MELPEYSNNEMIKYMINKCDFKDYYVSTESNIHRIEMFSKLKFTVVLDCFHNQGWINISEEYGYGVAKKDLIISLLNVCNLIIYYDSLRSGMNADTYKFDFSKSNIRLVRQKKESQKD
ncbi:hypothetical protein [Psychrobacter sp. JCM 18902]|uniref:hypothetical protein n=1 Tax=Psychrobacter sp. JCM 18902 TaxID=1298607 RepID=UPI001918ADFA|nr:hypothetical protein [Psychrobacter sp. JCM 18902]